MQRVRRIGMAMASVALVAACGGGGDPDGSDGLKGTWSHPGVGSVELDGDGAYEVDIATSDRPTSGTYEEVEGEEWDLIFVDEGAQAEAVLDGEEMTFYGGTWGQDEEFTLTRE